LANGKHFLDEGGNMKKTLIPTIVMVCLLMACSAMAMGRRGPDVDVVLSIPLLPPIVELQTEPYYNHSGYYYHFDNERWYYSRSRGGPWADLPRDHYPKETRYKGKHWQHDRGLNNDDRHRDNRDNRGNDDRDRDQRDDNRGHDNRR
jgi:hypothetical protein